MDLFGLGSGQRATWPLSFFLGDMRLRGDEIGFACWVAPGKFGDAGIIYVLRKILSNIRETVDLF